MRLALMWRPPVALRVLIAATAIVAAAGCSDEITPTPPTPPVTPPPVVPAPVVTSLTTSATGRVEAGQDVAITAAVTDGAPAASTLTYIWSANVGTITPGSGSTATWRLTADAISAGVDVSITLVLVKPYQVVENNVLVSREHRVVAQAPVFRAHDSTNEIRRITVTFLVDYFGNSNISPDACLVDFSTSCSGREAERGDIIGNRRDRRITSAQATVQSVTFNTENTTGRVVAPCTFRDIELATGKPFVASGNCLLSAVYEQQRWWLCTSNFEGTLVPGAAPQGIRGRVRLGEYWRYAVPDE